MYMFRRNDWLVLAAIGCVLLLLLFFRFDPLRRDAYTLLVESDSLVEEIRVTPALSRILSLEGPRGTTQVHIQGGKVWVAYSPCPDKVCLEMGNIPDNGGFIACIPNRVVLRMKGTTVSPGSSQGHCCDESIE